MSRYIKLFEAFIEKVDIIDTIEDVNSIIDYEWNQTDRQIWRGSKDSPKSSYIFRIDGTERGGEGINREILRKLPSWRKFSNRLGSVIGTTSFEYADSWGRYTYAIIPLKNEIIVGINNDINLPGAFDLSPIYTNYNFDESVNKDYETLHGVIGKLLRPINPIREFYINIDKFNIEEIISHYDHTIEDLRKEYFEIDKKVERSRKLELENKMEFHKLVPYIRQNNIKSTLELFDSLLDPIKNGYRKMKYTDYVKELNTYDNENMDMFGSQTFEVWFECDCIFLSEETYINMEEL